MRYEIHTALAIEYRRMLERCQQKFTFYAEQHRVKKTPEADVKAKVNEDLALEIRQLLDK